MTSSKGLEKSAFRSDLVVLLALAVARLVLHLFLNTQYGFHRDELQVLDDARPWPGATCRIHR